MYNYLHVYMHFTHIKLSTFLLCMTLCSCKNCYKDTAIVTNIPIIPIFTVGHYVIIIIIIINGQTAMPGMHVSSIHSASFFIISACVCQLTKQFTTAREGLPQQ